ncbi:Sensor kinase CckA [bacterium HR11]|nr:Sensor kinase CckA [bacterium HR11]
MAQRRPRKEKSERIVPEGLSEAILRKVLEHAPLAIALVDRTGRPVLVNQALCDMLGYTADELCRMRFTEFTHPEDATADWELFQELLKGRRSSYTLRKRYIRKDGQVVPALLSVGLVRDERGRPQVIIGMARDITAQVSAEAQAQAYLERLELLRMAFEHAGEAVFITDVNGTILWVNPAFTATTGYTAEEAVGQNPRILKSGIHPREFYERFWSHILAGQVWRGVFINRRKDGTLYYDERTIAPVRDAEGRITHFVAIGEDVTERVRMQEALRRHERHLEMRSRILSATLEAADLDERLNRILDAVLESMGTEIGGIHLVMDDKVVLRAWRGMSDEFRAHVQVFPVAEAPDWMRTAQVVHERLSEAGRTPDFAKREGIQAWAAVPLELPTGEWLGTLMLGSRRYEALREEDVRALWDVSRQVALAVWHARLRRSAEERLRRLMVLREIDRAIIQKLNLREVLEAVLAGIPAEMGAEAVAVSLLDETRTRFRVFLMRLPNGRVVEEPAFEVADSLLHWFVERQEPVIIYDVTQDPRLQTYREVLRGERLFSYVGVPLVAQGVTIGILHMFTTTPRVFSDEDVTFFQTLAGQAAIAIDNARMFHEAVQRLRSAEHTLAAQIRIALSAPEAVAERVLQELQAALGVEHADFYGYDESAGVLRLRACVGFAADRLASVTAEPGSVVRLGEGLVGRVAAEGRSVYVPDTAREPRWRGFAYDAARPLRSAYLAPVRFGDQLFGVIVLMADEPGAFPALQREMIDNFAGYIGASLAVVRLLTEVRRRADQSEALHRIVRAADERLDRRGIIETALLGLEQALPGTALAVFSYDGAADVLVLEGYNEVARPVAVALGMDVGSVVEAGRFRWLGDLKQGQALRLDDLEALAEAYFQRLVRAAGLRSALLVPIVSEGNLLGILHVGRTAPRAFTAADEAFLTALADHLAVAFRNARLFADLERAYRDLQQAQTALLQQERLRALGEMASGIVHDINNALVPIVGYAELLEQHRDEQVRERARRLSEAAADIVRIVERLRAFYRPRGPEEALEMVDLNEAVRRVVELTRPRWYDMPQREGVTVDVEMDLAEDLPPTAADGAEVREALTNLVFNAVDAVLAKGEARGRIVLRTRQQGEWAVVEVVDTGVGMDEETKRRAVEPFFTTKGERGSGLGLAMVYGTMRRHDGGLELESEPGRGTTARLIFPIRTVEWKAEAESPETPTAPLQVLLVDDDPRVRQVLGVMIQEMGHRVTVAESGAQGLRLFEEAIQRGEPYDVVLTDLGMPGVTGAEVVRRVKAVRPSTSVVVLTGWGPEAKPREADAALGKPPVWRELKALFARLASRKT